MTRRNRQDLAPSLFPFLAVLVCTLGTLILLLALIAKDAATVVQQQARDAINSRTIAVDRNRITQAQAAAMIDESAFRIAAVEKIRNEQAAALEERRDQLTHLEDHIDRLKQSVERLNVEMVSATSNGQTDQIDSSTIAMLKDQIAEEQLAIEELKETKGNDTPRVVIVPHKGPNGTTRRPIYVECTANGITIWPEGVRVSIEHLKDRHSRSSNPLDAALRIARLHAMKAYGDADPPYPLLVVRPHGTDAYFRATTAMNDWDDQYGYEMLDDGIDLAFSTSDPNLKRKMERAIRQAIARQADRRVTKAVTLSASQLSRDGSARGFYERPTHGYGNGTRGKSNDLQHQANRLDEIYRQAADELRSRDGRDPNGIEAVPDTDPNKTRDASTLNKSDSTANSPLDANASTQQSVTAGKSGSAIEGGKNQQSNSRRNDQILGAPNAATSESCEPCQDQQPQSVSAQIVRRDGENWALPSRVKNSSGIAIVRSIRVESYANRFVVPASRTDPRKVIVIDGNLDHASLRLATVLRDRIDRWGVALDNGRWEPILEVDLMGDDSGRLVQLIDLFKDSGIEVKPRQLQ